MWPGYRGIPLVEMMPSRTEHLWSDVHERRLRVASASRVHSSMMFKNLTCRRRQLCRTGRPASTYGPAVGPSTVDGRASLTRYFVRTRAGRVSPSSPQRWRGAYCWPPAALRGQWHAGPTNTPSPSKPCQVPGVLRLSLARQRIMRITNHRDPQATNDYAETLTV